MQNGRKRADVLTLGYRLAAVGAFRGLSAAAAAPGWAAVCLQPSYFAECLREKVLIPGVPIARAQNAFAVAVVFLSVNECPWLPLQEQSDRVARISPSQPHLRLA